VTIYQILETAAQNKLSVKTQEKCQRVQLVLSEKQQLFKSLNEYSRAELLNGFKRGVAKYKGRKRYV